MNNFSVVILAAGKGKRFHSKIPKVFHKICGKTMVSYIVDTVRELNPHRIIMVVPRNMKPDIVGVDFITQEEPKGTGDALITAKPALEDVEHILVLPGDVPLIATSTLNSLIKKHNDNSCTILTMVLEDPAYYGRIIKNKKGVVKIVEFRDASKEQRKIKEVNTAIFMFNRLELFESLKELTPENAQKEYYLTDVVGIMKSKGCKIETFIVENNIEVTGINDRSALSYVTGILEKRIIKEHQLQGVTINEPVAIDYNVKIGKGTVIYPFTALYGKTIIGEGCTIGPNVVIIESSIPQGIVIKPFTSIINKK